ncbi:DUF4097 family beta strand repeat-containing protein [Mycobacterium deserti]|uniref:DUF4097 domain-containing protein n=1 Tax=Mycobacterium deserti TaxID=2978347 RepID=A0ABT2MAR4_9MYCO|nr:DUF4097 domain-containing protein [Mycobacterium deserti]MCT7659363.1 DUF4097 domain-containing protein [Mycobacterium deserti]
MPTFDSPQPITATVDIAAGAVRLVASDRADTVVQVRPRDESRPQDVRAAEQVRVDFVGGALSVSSSRGFSFPRRGAVVVDIALPTGSRLHASVVSAQLSADGSFDDCRLASASGDVTVGSARGVKVDTASGDVSVRVAESVSVSTASGDAAVGEARGEVKFRAASGSLAVGRLEGNLNAQTASGDVGVASAVKGAVAVQTSSGEVSVGIAEGTAAKLDLSTRSGTVRNSLAPSDGPADGDEQLVVHAQTASGDVIVRRATDPAAA